MGWCADLVLSSLDLLAIIVVIIPIVVCFDVLWYHLLALWRDNHCLEGSGVWSRGPIKLNLWGICRLFPCLWVLCRCVRLVYVDKRVWMLFCLLRPRGDVCIFIDNDDLCLFLIHHGAIARNISLYSKSAFVLSWFAVMVLFGYILFICFGLTWVVGCIEPLVFVVGRGVGGVPVRPGIYYILLIFVSICGDVCMLWTNG